MGLDIYLYRYDDYQKSKDLEKISSSYSDELFKYDDEDYYEKLSDEQKDELRYKLSEYNQSLGLNEYGEDVTNKEQIEKNSEIDHEHYFKVGYFRSSYNEGGINNVLSNFGIPRLEYIFDCENGMGDEFQPDWILALERVHEVINKLKAEGNYRCRSLGTYFSNQTNVNSEADALKVFKNEKITHEGIDGSYSNIYGEFYLHEPAKILGFVQGNRTFLNRVEKTNYVITENDNTWYVTALEIILETIEYVLSDKDKIKQYYLYWSG